MDSAPSFLAAAAAIGYRGVDFLPRELWPAARAAGLELVSIDGHLPIEVGFNDRRRHDQLAAQVRGALELAKAADARFVTVASGDRLPEPDDDGMAACVEALAPLAAEAHARGLVLLLEPLNSKIDHPGHECDRTEWAVSVVEQIGSPGLRVLYDFYHAQIMEGDLLRTVQRHWSRIAHFHTAGVPGRHELDDAQEINWRAIAGLLRSNGYAGYVVHEFLPRGNPVDGLREAFALFAD